MKRFFVNKTLSVGDKFNIEGIEHNHIKNVMRMQIGDEIILVCGDEYDYHARITSISKGQTSVEILDREINSRNPKSNVTVYQALVKSDNMSLIIQKLTELGVSTFVPFESEFITSKDKAGKTDKLQEISNQSIKQCKRSMPMRITPTHSFKQIVESLKNLDKVIFANECEDTQDLSSLELNPNEKVGIIIGSEGGFSPSEIEILKGIKVNSVSLGKRILRAETCAIALTSVVMYLMGEWTNG